MSIKDDGGPVYPQRTGTNREGEPIKHPGISLRDYFSAHALPAVMQQMGMDVMDARPEMAMQLAYAIADAMLVERSKP